MQTQPTSTQASTSTPSVTLTFSPSDLSQLEAFAALHGTTVAAFIQKAALEAAHIKTPTTKKSNANDPNDTGALWLTDGLSETPEVEVTELFAPVDTVDEPGAVEAAPVAVAPKRGIVGEQSHLAHGHGPVWEIRKALGRERVHGLGWTREQLAFVLKLSVVGVRKMEYLGTTPVKSLESRRTLLDLAKALENPGAAIAAYIEREQAALG